MKGLWMAGAAALALGGCAGTSDEAAAPSAMASGVPAAATAAAAPVRAADYVTQAALSDMYEIQSSQLALTRGSSAVKGFAQQMITDHTATTNALTATLTSANMPASPPATLDPRRQAMIAALNGASGPAFDQLYLHQQLMAHQEALALHSGYAQAGDAPPLKAFAGQVAGRVQMHLDMLRTLGAT